MEQHQQGMGLVSAPLDERDNAATPRLHAVCLNDRKMGTVKEVDHFIMDIMCPSPAMKAFPWWAQGTLNATPSKSGVMIHPSARRLHVTHRLSQRMEKYTGMKITKLNSSMAKS
jgi:hypothetical protein